MFNKVESPVCMACQPAEDSDGEKIRAVLDETPGLNAEQVAEAADVELNVVHRMIQQGLIATAVTSEPAICGQCGAPAISHAKRLCEACLEKLNADVARAQSTIKLSERKAPEIGKYGMHVRPALDSKRKR
jgi:predicted amidophosphoribosyltransferase